MDMSLSHAVVKSSDIHRGPLANVDLFLPREATRSAVLPRQVVSLSVCPSVRLSVTLRYRDHIGWNSAKIIPRLISLTISLSADPNMTDLLQRQHPQILAGIGGVGKIVDV